MPALVAACTAGNVVMKGGDTPKASLVLSATDALPSASSPTVPTYTATMTSASTALPESTYATASPGSAHFIGETIPDCTRVDAGESFAETWNLSNAGRTAWTTG